MPTNRPVLKKQCPLWASFFLLIAIILAPSQMAASVPDPVQIDGVANAFRLSDQIFSGSEPDGKSTFSALKDLGITIVVSVDGRKPDLETAKRHGLRYVHLPVGYDGLSEKRHSQLATVADLLGSGKKAYIHCHQGKHRGPTAAAILARDMEKWSTRKARAWLQTAGTDPAYKGLYESVTHWKPAKSGLATQAEELPETAETSGIVESMVALDQHLTALKHLQKAGWPKTSTHPNASKPGMEVATLLWEGYREIARLPDFSKRPANYRTLLSDGETGASRLRSSIRSETPSQINETLKKVRQNCASCHKRYRK